MDKSIMDINKESIHKLIRNLDEHAKEIHTIFHISLDEIKVKLEEILLNLPEKYTNDKRKIFEKYDNNVNNDDIVNDIKENIFAIYHKSFSLNHKSFSLNNDEYLETIKFYYNLHFFYLNKKHLEAPTKHLEAAKNLDAAFKKYEAARKQLEAARKNHEESKIFGGGYHEKYLKYKYKYLQLKNKLI